MDTAEPELNIAKDSRMFYVLGKDTMMKMKQSNILIIGLRGLGVELAKNVILAGVRSVAVHDDGLVAIEDLSSQFYLNELDVGKPRGESCVGKLAELNRSVQVMLHTGALDEEYLRGFQVVCSTNNQSQAEWLRIGNICHSNGIHFISGDTFGLFARIFVDFGEKFVVTDANGEQPLTSHVGFISQEAAGVVRVLEDQRHGLETGMYVRFTEVEGMAELNAMDPMPVKVTGPFTFTIGDTTQFHPYIRGGIIEEVKMPKLVAFKPLAASLHAPEYLISDFAKMDRMDHLHIGMQAMGVFFDRTGRMPALRDEADALAVCDVAEQINREQKRVGEVDRNLIRQLCLTARANTSPMVAFLGGVLGQEVLKACSGKFMPIYQWLYYDTLEALPKEELPAEEFKPLNNRYDDQVAIFGRTMQEHLSNLKIFVVGAGAIGCELLKNLALMGVGTGPRGQLIVTDMDTIEISNLNRQFLFRDKDVQHLKSEAAAAAIKVMNPHVKIKAYQDKVGPETESVFTDDFWQSLDGVCNALDNVQARLYVDERCRYYARPLLESGTLGTKGNVQVVVPFLTETYGSSRDPPEKETPMCTIKNFPFQIDHTIHWSRDLLAGLFSTSIDDVLSYITNPSFLPDVLKQPHRSVTIEALHDNLVLRQPRDFRDCVIWARFKFEELFNHTIQQLLWSFPADMITTSGAPFWSGTKRVPKPLVFDVTNPLHLEFVRAAANLRAYNYGIRGTATHDNDGAAFAQAMQGVAVPEFAPKRGVKIAVSEQDKQEEETNPDDELTARLLKELPPPQHAVHGIQPRPVEFEKDDDSNWHMQFITAASNCRAANYSIAQVDIHETRRVAGRIIPAIVTTTAMVTGLVCTELMKVIQRKPLEDYKNAFANLALPFFGFSEPIAAPKRKEGEHEFTLWDFIDVREGRDLTLQEFIDWFDRKYGWEVSMISAGVAVVYLAWWPQTKRQERLRSKVAEVVQTLAKQEFAPSVKTFMLQVCCEDKEGTEREIPDVRYTFRQ
eukprot:TRINITY_DN11094_c0_g1_i2.p1 TRINITY_DN11094_c0_g1~~TRINITY_DN11094_c0_g1_i2.p1  ORF type:complete len:1012 (-),score=278.08 TRINITY_DN11094_c0_g1_i2:4384-7419(-)